MAGLTQQTSERDRIFGTKAGSKSGKSENVEHSAGSSPLCPQCGSRKLYKDGMRPLRDGSDTQRWLCRNCGHRFSEAKPLNRSSAYSSSSQICDLLAEESKNLALAENPPKTGLAGATEQTPGIKGKIIEYSFWLLKQGYAKSTIEGRAKLMTRFAKLGANLYDPESIKVIIAKQTWSEGRKEFAVEAYTNFLIMVDGKWDPPKYRRIEKLPFIPTEQEIDQLIAGCGEKTATFLQTLKETAMRAGEAWNLKWTDIDFVNATVRVTPEKRSNPRMFKVSTKLLAMLSMLRKKSELVFGTYDMRGFRRPYTRQRRRIALKLGNPRLNQITFHTFRHWKATMEYHKTKDILYVMRLLGHKNIKNTLVYTQLITFEDDDYTCKAATDVKDATELIEAGYEYVCDMNNIKLFRKRK